MHVEPDAIGMTPEPLPDAAARLRLSNRKTALVLLGIAAVFFVGIIATRFIGSPAIGIGVMGTVVLLFLVVAIGRNLRGTAERAGRSQGPKGAPARDAAGAEARPHDLAGGVNEAPR